MSEVYTSMITYCTNIHPGETWNDVFWNVQTHVLTVKKAVSSHAPFPIGLRLSNQAAYEIDDSTCSQFLDWCLEHDCFVPTINGFSYGSFHSTQIKEKVYLPDWRSEQRAAYTKRLSNLLSRWLPENLKGSISTVPIGFKSCIKQEDLCIVRKNLITTLEHLHNIRQKSGKEIILCLEPEPGCVLETTSEVVHFFEQINFPHELRDHLGICFDCCHQAVQFENPSESLKLLSEHDIEIGKIQVSSALRIHNADRDALKKFCEPCYLHQTVIKNSDKSYTHYRDLYEALSTHDMSPEQEWRIHFHIPVFIERAYNYETTQYFIEQTLSQVNRDILLEVETYTWNVLPKELRLNSVTE